MAVAGSIGVITSAELADGAVTNDKLGTDISITSTQISSGAVQGNAIAAYGIEYLAIGGGAQGGFGRGGGGGAGEHQQTSCSVLKGKVYSIIVGAGGSSNLDSGNQSFILGDGLQVISLGGGYGAQGLTTGMCGGSGGSGGGGAGGTTDNSGGGGNVPNTGNPGGSGYNDAEPYNGGGGGGADVRGGEHAIGATGGNGRASTITGASVTRCGGGGSGGYGTLGGGAGGSGGGGAGDPNSSTGTAGTANTGGGGGGGGNGALGGAGGSGIVILRIYTDDYSGTTTGSPTISTTSSFTVLQYTGSGTYTA